MNAKSFPQLLAQIRQPLQTLLNHLLSLGDVFGHSSFMFPDARRTLCFVELHLRWDKYQLVFNVFINIQRYDKRTLKLI